MHCSCPRLGLKQQWVRPFAKRAHASQSIPKQRQRDFQQHNVRASLRGSDDQEWSSDFATPEKVITFLTSEGLVSFSSGQSSPIVTLDRQIARVPRQPLPTFEEQGLCIGATFTVKASNGYDLSRRVRVLGFCRSIELLSEAVEDTVLRHGGEVWHRDTELSSGLEQRLVMTVALPLLWGVPPAYDTLSQAIAHGGGIVHHVSKQWQLL